MSIATRINATQGQPLVSFEMFPPRPSATASTLETLDMFAKAQPDFISVTYGAGGSTTKTSAELLAYILQNTSVEALGHFTLMGATKAELRERITLLLTQGVINFLALRGDRPANQPDWQHPADGLHTSAELVALIREIAAENPAVNAAVGQNENSVSIGVATYASVKGQQLQDTVAVLREKQDAGADFAITQVFYTVEDYIRHMDEAQRQGVHIPVIPGIAPLTDPSRLHRLQQISGVEVPDQIWKLLDQPSSERTFAAGLTATVNFIKELWDQGAPGVHIYTFNQPHPALDIVARLRD